MKANIGIRRRLSPLLDNDRNQLELFTALLLSLPGSPVLYYGDEIGMGDNIWLGDRDGVRTPMQWTPGVNGGFSSCDPARLYLPVIMDPIYGYQALNVEAQEKNQGSLLHWTRRMIEIRKRHPVFALGSYDELSSSNPSVLAFVREYEVEAGTNADGTDRILCVNNLSRFPQPAELDLSRFEGSTPIECMGGVTFAPIKNDGYPMTLPPYGFFWFILHVPPPPGLPSSGGSPVPPERAAAVHPAPAAGFIAAPGRAGHRGPAERTGRGQRAGPRSGLRFAPARQRIWPWTTALIGLGPPALSRISGSRMLEDLGVVAMIDEVPARSHTPLEKCWA
jgi:hypothetical protein